MENVSYICSMIIQVLIEIDSNTGNTRTIFPTGVNAGMIVDAMDEVINNLVDVMEEVAMKNNPGANREALNKAMDVLNMEDVLDVMEPVEQTPPPVPPAKPKQRRSRVTTKKP